MTESPRGPNTGAPRERPHEFDLVLGAVIPDGGPEAGFRGTHRLVAEESYPLTDEQERRREHGSRKDTTCGFCDRSEPEAEFREEKHLIPAALGNRVIFSNEECDACNQRWSEVDEQLGSFYAPTRAILGVRRRQGVGPLELKGSGNLSSIRKGKDRRTTEIRVHAEDPSISIRYKDENTFELSFVRPPYRPVAAVQAILRSAWMLLRPDQRRRHEVIRRTLFAPRLPLRYWEVFVPGGHPNRAYLRVWERRDGDAGGAGAVLVEFRLGSIVLVWASPDTAHAYRDSALPPVFVSRPPSPDLKEQVVIRQADVVKDEPLPAAPSSFTMSYLKRVEAAEDPPAPVEAASPKKGRPTLSVTMELDGATREALAKYGPVQLTFQRADEKRLRVRIGGPTDLFELVLDRPMDSDATKIEFRTDPWGRKVSEVAALHRFMARMADEAEVDRLLLRSQESGEEVMQGAAMRGLGARCRDALDLPLLRDLVQLEERFNCGLGFPSEGDETAMSAVAVLAAGIRDGEVATKIEGGVSVILPPESARDLQEGVRAGQPLTFNGFVLSWPSEESPLPVGEVSLTVTKPSVVSAEQMSTPEGEQVRLRLTGELAVYTFHDHQKGRQR